MHAGARLDDHDGRKPDHQGQDGQGVEQPHRLDQRLADLTGVVEAGDAADDGAEDDGSDHHLDDLDEGVAQRLQRRSEIRPEMADQDADGQTDQDLEIERLIELLGLVRGRVQISGLDTH